MPSIVRRVQIQSLAYKRKEKELVSAAALAVAAGQQQDKVKGRLYLRADKHRPAACSHGRLSRKKILEHIVYH